MLNWLDIAILVPLAWFAFIGLKNGLIRELVSMVALILGIFITMKFSDVVAGWLGNVQHVKTIAFFLTFIITLIGVHLIGKLFENIWKTVIPAFINHLFGLLFGAGKVLIVISVLLSFIKIIDHKSIILTPAAQSSSLLYPYVEPIFPHCKAWVTELMVDH
ncbi:MAG: CvpA family protein [Bacteroidales bacterium]|jgi:membrane protein required for colicin V production|nr:CvpA family protein [Bacteroidales bacterium]